MSPMKTLATLNTSNVIYVVNRVFLVYTIPCESIRKKNGLYLWFTVSFTLDVL